MEFYYLHIYSVLDFDYEQTIHEDVEVYPPKISNVALEIDQKIDDAVFQVWPLYICESKIKLVLENEFSDIIQFSEINKIKKGQNLEALNPNYELKPSYWNMTFTGIPLEDQIGLWNNNYLIVSQHCLDLMRGNGVNSAESDLIDIPIETYFSTDRNLFWM